MGAPTIRQIWPQVHAVASARALVGYSTAADVEAMLTSAARRGLAGVIPCWYCLKVFGERALDRELPEECATAALEWGIQTPHRLGLAHVKARTARMMLCCLAEEAPLARGEIA
jgi:hypothetical protein